MNIAEIRKKARVSKPESDNPLVPAKGASNSLSEKPAGALLLAPQGSLPAKALKPNSDAVSPLLDRAAPVCRAEGKDRLDQLFSWMPEQEDHLLENTFDSSVEGKREDVVARRWLAFSLGSEDYALDISVIREILKLREITEIPRVPDFLLGIISLRGNIIPIFDLKRRMGLGVTTVGADSRIIVCQDGDRFAGLLIDRITQVASIQDEKIEPPPAIFSGRDRALFDGVGRVQENTLLLLNLSNVLTIDFNGL